MFYHEGFLSGERCAFVGDEINEAAVSSLTLFFSILIATSLSSFSIFFLREREREQQVRHSLATN